MIKCLYCNYFVKGNTIRRESDTGEKKKAGMIKKKCSPANKNVSFDDDACKYFAPFDTFQCDKMNQRINMTLCIARRLNKNNLEAFKGCKRCRQFDQEINPILATYGMEAQKIINPPQEKPVYQKPEETKLKRRKKKSAKPTRKKIIPKVKKRKPIKPKVKRRRRKL